MSFILPEFSAEALKDEYRAYLEENGIIEKIKSIFVTLKNMEKKPEDPLRFIKDSLDGTTTTSATNQEKITRMKNELDDLNNEIFKLRKILKDLGADENDIYLLSPEFTAYLNHHHPPNHDMHQKQDGPMIIKKEPCVH